MLLVAEYPVGGTVPLVISIDGGGTEEVVRAANAFEWPFGKKEVIEHPKNLGLRQHILSCGDLSEKYSAIIMLEDDLVVSPSFYHYASAAATFYDDEPHVAQISLYSYEHGEISMERFYPVKADSDVYFMQWASSWGQVWTKSQWRSFREWYLGVDSMRLQSVPMPSYVKGWPDSSWKKYFIAYLVEAKKFAVYPYYSFSSCYGDSGVNHKSGTLPVTQVALQIGEFDHRFVSFDGSFVKYDAYFQPHKELACQFDSSLSEYDFEVDFQGTRELSSVSREYLLSVKVCVSPMKTYGWNMYPFEMNLLNSDGNEFAFGKTSDFLDLIPRWKFVRLVLWSKRLLGALPAIYCALIKIYFKLIDRLISIVHGSKS